MSYKDNLIDVYEAEIESLRNALEICKINLHEGVRLVENLNNNTTDLLEEFDEMKKTLQEKEIVIKLLMNKNKAYDKFN